MKHVLAQEANTVKVNLNSQTPRRSDAAITCKICGQEDPLTFVSDGGCWRLTPEPQGRAGSCAAWHRVPLLRGASVTGEWALVAKQTDRPAWTAPKHPRSHLGAGDAGGQGSSLPPPVPFLRSADRLAGARQPGPDLQAPPAPSRSDSRPLSLPGRAGRLQQRHTATSRPVRGRAGLMIPP